MVAAPDADSTFWGSLIAGIAAIGALIGWLFRKIESVRTESARAIIEGDRLQKDALDRLRAEVAEGHRDTAKFREHMLSVVVTRGDLERAIDRQTEQLRDWFSSHRDRP